MFNFIIQLLVLSGINLLSAGKSLNKFHGDGTLLQQLQDFPCPDATDIAPCACIYDSDLDRLTLDCTQISSDEELANILAKEFPENDFYGFSMRNSSSLTSLNFTCGGVKFRRFELYPGPFQSLVDVSDAFYESCSNASLEFVRFETTQLSSLVFPPPPLSDKITGFLIPSSNLTSVPAISSDSLLYIDLSCAQISQITPGTFDEIPNLQSIHLFSNNIKVLKNGSIPITSNGYMFYFESNELETIEPGAFTLKGEPRLNFLRVTLEYNLLKTIDESVFGLLMPYINSLVISDNPLDCGCDLAWIILNPEYLEKVTNTYPTPTCADGTLLTDLDPTQYEEFCL